MNQIETRPNGHADAQRLKRSQANKAHTLTIRQIKTNTKRKEANMSQTYKHLSKLTKAELIQIIKDSDFTINALTKELKSRS